MPLTDIRVEQYESILKSLNQITPYCLWERKFEPEAYPHTECLTEKLEFLYAEEVAVEAEANAAT